MMESPLEAPFLQVHGTNKDFYHKRCDLSICQSLARRLKVIIFFFILLGVPVIQALIVYVKL